MNGKPRTLNPATSVQNRASRTLNPEPGTPNPELRTHPFTLVELLAAMGVFVILMAVMFEFLGGAQQVWSLSKRNAKIYQNARVAMDLISRDIQGAVASDMNGEEIPFYYDAGDNRVTMVSASNLTISGSTSKLTKVRYKRDTTVDEKPLLREIACAVSPYTYWDFYGKTTSSGWETNFDPASDDCREDTIIEGVKALAITCYDSTGSPLGSTTTRNQLPAYAQVSLTLVDPALLKNGFAITSDKVKKTQRTFTKTVYFRSGE